MQEISFRNAKRTDTNRIVDIIIGDTEQVTTQVGIKLFGVTDTDQLKLISQAMARSTQSWEFTTVAEKDGQQIGVLQVAEPSLKMTFGLLFVAIRIYGLQFMRKLMPRIQLLNRVQTNAPPGSYKISELHVAPGYRGQGVGKAILTYAENDARKTGHSAMSLQTWITNPAEKLYERFGFKVVETSTDDEFERLTGVAGNKLMVKELEYSN